MKRFVIHFHPMYGEPPMEEQITNYAEYNNLTIITIAPMSGNGIYVLFEENEKTEDIVFLKDLTKRQQAEIEKLKAERDVFREDNYILVTEVIENARVGAIKEFMEYVCDGRVDNDPVVIAAKCAVKEITEGKK